MLAGGAGDAARGDITFGISGLYLRHAPFTHCDPKGVALSDGLLWHALPGRSYGNGALPSALSPGGLLVEVPDLRYERFVFSRADGALQLKLEAGPRWRVRARIDLRTSGLQGLTRARPPVH